MKNADIYSIVSHSKYSALLHVNENKNEKKDCLLAVVPVKIDGLCGHEIQGK